MSWESLAWRPLDATSLPAAAPIADVAGALRSAVEETLSGEHRAPVVVTGAEVAELAGTELPGDAVPMATIELVGAPRRLVVGAALPAGEGGPTGPDIEATTTGSLVLRAADGVIAAVAGEGLNLGAADGAALAEGSELVALRLDFGTDGRPLGSLVLAVEAAAIAELAAHVAALRALEAAAAEAAETTATADPAEEPSTPGDGIGGGAPGPVTATEPVSDPAIRSVAFPDLGPRAGVGPGSTEPARSIDLLLGVQLQVSVEIGRARLPIRDVLALGPGSIVELDKLAGEKADILVNGHPVAQGEVVVVDENFGVRITDVVSRQRRILSVDGAP